MTEIILTKGEIQSLRKGYTINKEVTYLDMSTETFQIRMEK